jgi:hypothetical protein
VLVEVVGAVVEPGVVVANPDELEWVQPAASMRTRITC